MRITFLALLFLSSSAAARAQMAGMYGSYPDHRDATGTSWQPDSTPMEGVHEMTGDWTLMLHGYATGVYDDQGGPRGDTKFFSASMLMGKADRPLGPGTVGLHAMLSLDPAMGPSGYPLLLQTGETADGSTPLIDRQHPHDLFMELAASYSLPAGDDSSVFLYGGLPGEPALGPVAFVHRYSGMELPEAPLSHHWLDSTHVTYGVVTAGWVIGNVKLEGSSFRGREPDQHRWDIESPSLDSWSGRLSWNPSSDWALQASFGHLHSPEQLQPGMDTDRITASASLNGGGETPWQATLAWGRDVDRPGRTLDALLLEGTLHLDSHAVMGRAELVDKDELFVSPSPLAGQAFWVGKLSLGYLYDFLEAAHAVLGAGAVASAYLLPEAVRPAYGGTPLSFMVYVRVRLA